MVIDEMINFFSIFDFFNFFLWCSKVWEVDVGIVWEFLVKGIMNFGIGICIIVVYIIVDM